MSKCKGENCPIKNKCYRYTAKGIKNKERQTWTGHFYVRGQCQGFWDNSKLN